MKSTIIVLGLLVLGISSSCQSQTSSSAALITVNEAKEVSQIISSEKVQLIDVRSVDEYKAGHITGATLISIHDPNFLEQMNKLDRDIPLVVYCAVGGRSTTAVNSVSDLGFKKIYNYKGGMRNWMSSGMEITKE